MVPQTKVFVGSLPQGSKPEDLRKLFERFGAVTECDIMNRCGFVHMQTEDQASAAIRGLNNTTFNGAVISVERGRIKERGQRGGGRGGGMRGGMRGGMDRRGGGGPMRGGGGGGRDAPYMRDSRPMGHMRGGDMRGPHMGGMGMGGGARNGMGGGYERGPERAPAAYDDRYNGYGGEDRRGFALSRDPYAAPAPMYADERRGYSAPVDDMGGMYGEERRAPLYPDERELMERRAPYRAAVPMAAGYDRSAPTQRAAGMGNGDMFSRRSPMDRGGAAVSGYDRDPYGQQYAPMGRGGGGAARGREHSGGMGPRRY
ncbi:H/ACA ribonucleoprotein complex subunit 1-like isoform X1 [Plodia interpunctella]|uniref:H/ACA ribonucleoprotein complex subunit 1-like isoform X1 n=1 Tax=Plodia interpunctella TaxID=58824 RepID=UPI003100ED57